MSAWRALAAAFLLLALPLSAVAAAENLLEFRGQVTLPPHVLKPRETLSVTLLAVHSPFRRHTRADFKGRFRFRKLKSGSYVLSIFIPRRGEIQETVEITKSFSGPKGRVEKNFVFDEERLQAASKADARDVVSVRALSIPNNARREYTKAQTRLGRQDADGAIGHLQKAVKLAPQFAEAWNNLGTIYFQKKEFSNAERSFRMALEQDPESFEALVNLGGVLLAQKRTEEALAISLRAHSERPQDALANAQLGLCYFLLGDDKHAETFLRRTKEIDPAHFLTPEIPLAEIYVRRSDTAAALQELHDFLRVRPDSPQTPKVRAMIEKLQNGR